MPKLPNALLIKPFQGAEPERFLGVGDRMCLRIKDGRLVPAFPSEADVTLVGLEDERVRVRVTGDRSGLALNGRALRGPADVDIFPGEVIHGAVGGFQISSERLEDPIHGAVAQQEIASWNGGRLVPGRLMDRESAEATLLGPWHQVSAKAQAQARAFGEQWTFELVRPDGVRVTIAPGDAVMIGRGETASPGTRVPARGVSRQHLAVRNTGKNVLEVEDLGSSGGWSVNVLYQAPGTRGVVRSGETLWTDIVRWNAVAVGPQALSPEAQDAWQATHLEELVAFRHGRIVNADEPGATRPLTRGDALEYLERQQPEHLIGHPDPLPAQVSKRSGAALR